MCVCVPYHKVSSESRKWKFSELIYQGSLSGVAAFTYLVLKVKSSLDYLHLLPYKYEKDTNVFYCIFLLSVRTTNKGWYLV